MAEHHADGRITGPYGHAERIPIPAIPEASETVAWWVITAPHANPLWTQYLLCCIRLREIERLPPPVRDFPGASHQVTVFTLNPELGAHTGATMVTRARTGGALPVLQPVNVVAQFEATDAEMDELTTLAAAAVVDGHLSPETASLVLTTGAANANAAAADLARASAHAIREAWLASLVRTLAHIRGEPHAATDGGPVCGNPE